MSEVRLVVREAGDDWSGTMHGSDADRVIAALSAEALRGDCERTKDQVAWRVTTEKA